MSCLLQNYCHLSNNEKLSVSWQFFETYGVINYGSRLEEGSRKPVLGVWPALRGSHSRIDMGDAIGNPTLGRTLFPQMLHQQRPDLPWDLHWRGGWKFKVDVVLRLAQRPQGLLGTGSPGRPPGHSQGSSWPLKDGRTGVIVIRISTTNWTAFNLDLASLIFFFNSHDITDSTVKSVPWRSGGIYVTLSWRKEQRAGYIYVTLSWRKEQRAGCI